MTVMVVSEGESRRTEALVTSSRVSTFMTARFTVAFVHICNDTQRQQTMTINNNNNITTTITAALSTRYL